MKKLMAGLLIFTIGVGAKGVYCKADKPGDMMATQSGEKENTDEPTTKENSKDEVGKTKGKEEKKLIRANPQNKQNEEILLPQEIVKKLIEKEKIKKEIKETLKRFGKGLFESCMVTFFGAVSVLGHFTIGIFFVADTLFNLVRLVTM